MEIENSFLGTGHSCSILDNKSYPKGSEFENGDFFGIDDLFDFSNEEIGGPVGEVCDMGGSSAASVTEAINYNSSAGKSCLVPGVLDAAGPGDICIPCDDLAELEWLSNFVEESFSSAGATNMLSSGSNASHGEHNLFTGEQQFGSSSPISVLESSACLHAKLGNLNAELNVPGRARTKRWRNGICFWNTRILSASDVSTSILESSSSSTITATAPLSPDLDTFAYEHGGADSSPPRKKKKVKNNQGKQSKKAQDAVQARRCWHCGIQRTPQWRTGPMGPKTLCNACGVRYKSGRLLPEYRPAASPSFVESIHSNSHRKVLELRRQKEFEEFGAQANCSSEEDQWLEGPERHEQDQEEEEEEELAMELLEWDDGCLVAMEDNRVEVEGGGEIKW